MSDDSAISASEARANFNDVVNRVSYGHERVTITRNGKPAAVMVSIEDLELLERLEDAHWGDIASGRLEEARAGQEEPRSWRDVKAERGL